MAKTAQELLNQNNVNKGITTGLDSEATVKPQPSKDFNSWSNKTDGANPESPSTNNATRREKYGISQGTTVPESTKIGAYDTVSPVISTDRWTTPDSDSWNQYTWYIKKISGNSFITTEYDKLRKEIEDSLRAKGIDTTKEVYGSMITDYVNKAIQAEYDMWALSAQMSGLTDTQAYNVKLVDTLTKETWAGLAQGKSVKEIAEALWQDEWVIQKIAQGKHAELIQLSQEYEDEQMRKYLRYKEDLDTQMARNITQYQNAKTNLDYQFNSAMSTLKNSLFDAEWTARGTAAWLWMTGTSYLLDRIQNQYNNQMTDLQNTYEYQSANAQIAINNALEDYTTNVKRYMEDYSTAIKEIQSYVYDNYLKLSNQMLSAADQLKALSQVKANVEEMKANAIVSAAAALEDWNTALYNFIANTYWLDSADFTTHQFTNAELGRTSSSTIWNDTNNLWHILASDDWTRIWTYRSANGYTYNVYATREDWLLATQWLLQRAYYGKTLKEAAQKWIWQGKDISWAVAVLKELWLDPNAILSDENVRKFMEAIGRREWTIKKGETLDDWVKWWKDLSWYWTSSNWWESTWWNYDKAYTKDYDRYLTNWRDSFKKSTQEALIQQFWSMDNFIKNAQEYSESVIQPQQAQTFQSSLDILVEFNKAWNKLNDRQKWTVKKLWVKDSYQNWFYSDEVNNAVNLYKQLMAQWFIQNIIDSKKKWATYGPLSDNEWGKIQDAYSSMKLNAPEYVQGYIDYMMYDLSTAITELWWTPDIESWLQRDISSLYNNSNSQSVFNTPGSAYTWAGSVNSWTNSQWAYQSWTVNTWATQMW